MKHQTKYRILEIIPGAFLWTAFLLSLVLSFIKPLWVIYFIIVYDVFWFVRIMYFVTYLFISWRKYRETNKIDWFGKIKQIGGWEKYYHVVVLPTYQEPADVLWTTTKGLVENKYDSKKIIVLWTRECGERAGEEHEKVYLDTMKEIKEQLGDKFHAFLDYVHPPCQPGELAGKGAHETWALKKFKKEYVDQNNIEVENMIVSVLDSDTTISDQYLSRLTYLWMTSKNPHRHSYQPLTLYNNNIWDAPSFARVVANSTTFWLMMEKARPDRMFTFSSHSMSFKTLVEVGYYETNIVTEDSRIFLQCFNEFNGDYSVIPMYVPISMDTVMGKTAKQTIKLQYKQMRRWAWSVEHFPWMITNLFTNKKIKWQKKFKYLFNQFEGQISWATGPLFKLVLGRLPLTVASLKGEQVALIQNTPFVLETIMGFAMIGIVISAFINVFFLPARPPKYKRSKWIVMILQWLLLPITMIAFGSIPAIDAQTRLMLGGRFRLGFDVTVKHRR